MESRIERSFYRGWHETEEEYNIEITKEIARMKKLGYDDVAGQPIERVEVRNIGYTITFEKRED